MYIPLYYTLADTEMRVYFNMVKVRELTENERVAIKDLLKLQHMLIAANQELSMFSEAVKRESFANCQELVIQGNFWKGGERAICRIARKLWFATLVELKSAACAQFPKKNLSKYVARRIVRKNGLKSCKRKQKYFISRQIYMGKDTV